MAYWKVGSTALRSVVLIFEAFGGRRKAQVGGGWMDGWLDVLYERGYCENCNNYAPWGDTRTVGAAICYVVWFNCRD